MEKFFSERAHRIKSSSTIGRADNVKKLIKSGVDIIRMEIGEPDFITPKIIIDAATQAMSNGLTKYTSSSGIPDLKKAIINKLESQNRINSNLGEIIVTPGAKQGIYYALATLINKGDEVLIPDPSWGSFSNIIEYLGGISVHYHCPAKNDFKINITALANLVTNRTKVILLNYPCNPTGQTISKEELIEIAKIAQAHNLLIISDETYERILFDGTVHVSIASLPNMAPRIISVFSFSKTYAMTGWRLGYVVGPKPIISKMIQIQQQTATCPTSIAQAAGVKAFEAEADVQLMLKEYTKRRTFMLTGLKECGISCLPPPGTFYLFPDISRLGSSEEVADLFLEHAKVSVVPGTAFGKQGEGHIRMHFAASMPELEKAIRNIKLACKKE